MQIALYARVSLDDAIPFKDGKKYQEPENQLVPLREYCKMHLFEIKKEYVDRESGANPYRVEFRQMLEAASRGEFNAILVWKLDRFSREPMLSTLSYLKELQRKGVAVISMTESWLDTRTDNPMSEVVLAVMAWAAAEERRKISERTKAGIARLKAIGKWKGGRPRKGESIQPTLKPEV